MAPSTTSSLKNGPLFPIFARSAAPRKEHSLTKKRTREQFREILDSEAESFDTNSENEVGSHTNGGSFGTEIEVVPGPAQVVAQGRGFQADLPLNLDFLSDSEAEASKASESSNNRRGMRLRRRVTDETRLKMRHSLLALETVDDFVTLRHCTETPPTIVDSSDECIGNDDRMRIAASLSSLQDYFQPLIIVDDDGLPSSDPRSSVWKGRSHMNLAVVIQHTGILKPQGADRISQEKSDRNRCSIARITRKRGRDFLFDSEDDEGESAIFVQDY
ncbi:hypothetical protein PVAG01_03328 [Phlyctema vagabunda]|uniref:Uncharacterized protein n=1 Tax=Phlyctema vagabunda TaxID=108571 RepID=A0ABR4PL26_9HELO